MIEDVYEPLARYRDDFKAKFAALTRAKFKELTTASGIDVAANRRLIALIHELERKVESASGKKTLLGLGVALFFLAALACLVVFFLLEGNPNRISWLLGCLAGLLLGGALIPSFLRALRQIGTLRERIRRETDMAWKQMAPLNRLYTWDLTTRLIEQTVPRLAFDPYFTSRRLEDLRRLYGWSDRFNEGKSILFAQSGVINGNPFLFGEYLDQDWGTETYDGVLDIEWEEWEEDSDGDGHYVTRSETLHAQVEKPIPVYSRHKLLIYGNDAAPNLKFSREPSGFSSEGGGLIERWRKWRRLRKLEAFSRNLEDSSNFTLMGNHEFETWFHTPNRNNEVEFRLLFTPVAQLQMLALLQDHKVGYGDDFTFRKDHRINMLTSTHLDEAVLDTSPERFQDFDYDRARQTFQSFNEQYFKDVYFALAPLLAIPLYQQTRTHEDIWKGVLPSERSSFWEQESLANYYGDEQFRHPDCITENILKTRVLARDEDGVSRVAVTAHGFRGVNRVDYVSVHGGDGHWHDVPVEWIEYVPIQRTSEMCISEGESPKEHFACCYRQAGNAAYRRLIYSYLVTELGSPQGR